MRDCFVGRLRRLPRNDDKCMNLPFLETIGLTSNEAQLYTLLLKMGESSAADIIREAQLKRATAYKSLYSLEKKGLVTQQDKNKIIHFRPEPPQKLLELAEGQYNALDRATKDIRAILPEFVSSYILSVEKPVVTTFEGVKGLKQIYEDTLKVGQPIYAVLQAGEVEPELYKWLTTEYVKKRVKKNIQASVIVASSKESFEYAKQDEKELRITRMVPSISFPFQHEVDVYGDKVAFIHYKKGETLIGIVITHPGIAQTMKAWFDLGWKGAESLVRFLP